MSVTLGERDGKPVKQFGRVPVEDTRITLADIFLVALFVLILAVVAMPFVLWWWG